MSLCLHDSTCHKTSTMSNGEIWMTQFAKCKLRTFLWHYKYKYNTLPFLRIISKLLQLFFNFGGSTTCIFGNSFSRGRSSFTIRVLFLHCANLVAARCTLAHARRNAFAHCPKPDLPIQVEPFELFRMLQTNFVWIFDAHKFVIAASNKYFRDSFLICRKYGRIRRMHGSDFSIHYNHSTTQLLYKLQNNFQQTELTGDVKSDSW